MKNRLWTQAAFLLWRTFLLGLAILILGSFMACIKKITEVTVAEDVLAASEALTIGYSGGDSATNVTTNVIIPTNATNEVQVSWRSSDPNVISVIGTNGMVTRPLYSNGNQFVVLQATLIKDEFTNRKDFALTVIAQDPVEVVDDLMIAEDVLAASEERWTITLWGGSDRATRG